MCIFSEKFVTEFFSEHRWYGLDWIFNQLNQKWNELIVNSIVRLQFYSKLEVFNLNAHILFTLRRIKLDLIFRQFSSRWIEFKHTLNHNYEPNYNLCYSSSFDNDLFGTKSLIYNEKKTNWKLQWIFLMYTWKYWQINQLIWSINLEIVNAGFYFYQIESSVQTCITCVKRCFWQIFVYNKITIILLN